MTERLTRAQRREIEKKTHQKIDLDHLSEFDVSNVETAPTTTDKEEKDKDEELSEEEKLASDEEEELSEEEEKETFTKEESASDEEESASDEEESASDKEESASDKEESASDKEESASDSDMSSEEEEDLDALLDKAQAALKVHNIELEKKETPMSIKLSQMQTGLSDKELYLKTHSGRAKLVAEAVELLTPGEKPSRKSAVHLQESKDDDSKKMNRKQRQLEREKTTGSAWFDMPKTEITDEIRRDLQVLKMRHILDRKRHYKKMGNKPDPKYFQIGTIIESPTEFFSARMNKKERKQTIVEELMANDDQKQYYKRKFNEVQERTNSGGKKHFKKLKAQRSWAK